MASFTKENYIKALYYLHQKTGSISLSHLGEELQVSKPTANDMVKKLKEAGLVQYEKYKPIKITEKGKKQAATIIRKHRLAEMFLAQFMNFGWEEVHDIAEELEHIKSAAFFDRMDELLGFPTADPHGSPIPDKQGHFSKPSFLPLNQFMAGNKVVVRALHNSDAAFLVYLNNKNIALHTELTIKHVEPYDGSFTVAFKDKTETVLTAAVCEQLLVETLTKK